MSGLGSIVQKYNLIKQIPILQGLGWYNLQKVARRIQVLEFRKGDIIRKEGDPADGFYCLISGRVQMYSTSSTGKKIDVDFIRRGAHFGIISLLSNEPHSSTFEALNDSVVIKIDKEDFNELLQAMPQLGVELSHSLSRQLRNKAVAGKSLVENKIIAIYSPVQGTGSSTYAVNLAVHLERETHRKVILVSIHNSTRPDEPVSADETTPQWKQPAKDLNHILEGYEVIKQDIIRGQMNIDLLNLTFNPADNVLVEKMSDFVTTLVFDYHYVIVDLPTDIDDVVMKILTQADLVQLVTRSDKENLKTIQQVISDIAERLKEKFIPERVQVLLSSCEETPQMNFRDINTEIDFTVYTKLPHFKKEELGHPLITEALSITLPVDDSFYAFEIKKIARQLSGFSIGLVLGGGAALGIAHIGVLRVLEQERIPIDIVVGSSMGALIGAFWAMGKTTSQIETLAREFDRPKGMLKLWDPVIPIAGLMGGQKIVSWLDGRGLAGKTFYDTRIPLKVVAYDLHKREEMVIDSGAISNAIRQSIAIPGVIEPITNSGRMIIDGGVLNPLPTNVLIQSGVKKIIAVNVLQSPLDVVRGYEHEQHLLQEELKIRFAKHPVKFILVKIKKFCLGIFTPNIADIIVRSLQASEYMIAEESARKADVLIHPDLSGINWFELYKVDEMIRRGEEAARLALPQIKKLLSE